LLHASFFEAADMEDYIFKIVLFLAGIFFELFTPTYLKRIKVRKQFIKLLGLVMILLALVWFVGDQSQALSFAAAPPDARATLHPPIVMIPNSGNPEPTLLPTASDVAGIPAPTPTLQAFISVEGARLRAGPGTGYRILTSYPKDTLLNIQGRNADGSWFFVSGPGDRQGWIAVALVDYNREIDRLPLVQSPPTPAPTVIQNRKP
jgi:hypothetical protein